MIWLVFFRASAQGDQQQCIVTDVGILTVSQTVDGFDMIVLSVSVWNKMAAGTSYTSNRLNDSQSVACYIEIASKETGYCRKGIGFACSIFPCPANIAHYPLRVNDKNRFCRVLLQRDAAATVRMIFLDVVDWQDLAKTP
jgi:hypothetical protein